MLIKEMTYDEPGSEEGTASSSTSTLAQGCLTTLQLGLVDPEVLRDLARQHKRLHQALLPLVSLGSEWDVEGLWSVACALDGRLAGLSFSGDDPEAVRLLETALDSAAAAVIEALLPSVGRLFPDVSLGRGLIEGHWTVYAIIPRGARLNPPVPEQMALW